MVYYFQRVLLIVQLGFVLLVYEQNLSVKSALYCLYNRALLRIDIIYFVTRCICRLTIVLCIIYIT